MSGEAMRHVVGHSCLKNFGVSSEDEKCFEQSSDRILHEFQKHDLVLVLKIQRQGQMGAEELGGSCRHNYGLLRSGLYIF